jgi:hypothetical protein
MAAAILTVILIVSLPLLHRLRRHGRPEALVPPPLRSPHPRSEHH